MSRGMLVFIGVIATATVFTLYWRPRFVNHEVPQTVSSRLEASPVCPWRDPRRDLIALFPRATNYVMETRILSRAMAPIQKRLGRPMTPGENPLRIHRVSHAGETLGSVLVCRVKGEHGGVEVVTGVDSRGVVSGVVIQSHREPESVARRITSPEWLTHFVGKDADAPLQVGVDLPGVMPEESMTAQAIADGVRSELILFSFAERPFELQESGAPSHR